MRCHATGYVLEFSIAVFLATGCGGTESETQIPTTGKTTGALTPAPFTHSFPEPGSTWKDKIPSIPSILSGLESADYCPEPIIHINPGTIVSPPSNMHLDGTDSVPKTGAITNYSWSIHQPPENAFAIVPTLVFPEPTHQVSAPGIYRYCLDVCDEAHCSLELDCLATACVEVETLQVDGIHVDLTWDTPDDLNQFDQGPNSGADMDLHFTHPYATGPDLDGNGEPDGWFDLTYDCFWFNPQPEWESMNPNINDDPNLLVDDNDGAGPEITLLHEPGSGAYKVGVHYWDDHGYGKSYPRVRIYLYGELIFEKNLFDTDSMAECDLWEVATIAWPSGEVVPILDQSGDLKITHCYATPSSMQIGSCCP